MSTSLEALAYTSTVPYTAIHWHTVLSFAAPRGHAVINNRAARAMTTLLVGGHRLAAPLCAALAQTNPQGSVRHAPGGLEPGSCSEGAFPDSAQGGGDAAAAAPQAVEAAGLLAGVETVVLLPPPALPEVGAAATGGAWLDHATRGTYDLLRAAVVAGAKKVVCLSSMALLERYPPQLLVDVQYKPLPSVAPGPLSSHLQEFICREFGAPPCSTRAATDQAVPARTLSLLHVPSIVSAAPGRQHQYARHALAGRLGLLRTVIARLGNPDCGRWPLSDHEAVGAVAELLAPGWRPTQRGDIVELTPPVDGNDPDDAFRDHLPWRYTGARRPDYNAWPYGGRHGGPRATHCSRSPPQRLAQLRRARAGRRRARRRTR
eukprot:SAG11_NODE_168_length_13643_cov_5.436651_1_plen_374_part_10